ncbi:hypothetical protein GCM10007352_38210 [Mucilaginibacter phyllosphaerae]|nr:hypothetical protein GCM10007352_38210 [Mucilaginibacter phyllosphaerae]
MLFYSITAFSQNLRVTGVVTDAKTGEKLVGVSVLVKGTGTRARTGVNGDYTINVAPNGTLVFSYIGYTQQEVPVNNQITLNVSLQGTATQLQQVVVVGYGMQRRDVTGAVSRVGGEDIARQPVQTPTQALQGRAPCVQSIGSGQPNAQPQVLIRGVGSVLAWAGPLYVVATRFFDLVRQDGLRPGRAEAAFRIHGKRWNAARSLFPIPQQQIDLSGRRLTQNQGYD